MTDIPEPQAATPIPVDAFCPICGLRVDLFYPTSGGKSAYVMPCGDELHEQIRYTVRFAKPGS